MQLDSIVFTSIHNHNPGFPTENGYNVNLRLDSGSGPATANSFFANTSTSGTVKTLAINRLLGAGTHTLSFAPNAGFNTASELFGLDNVTPNATTPEPGTVIMLSAGLAALAWKRRRR